MLKAPRIFCLIFLLGCSPPVPVTTCYADTDCPNGYRCDQRQYCFLTAELDAGQFDHVASFDAYGTDVLVVNIDGSVPDALAPDISLPDTAQPDTFVPDAFVSDTLAEDTWTCQPTGPEIVYLGGDNCADGEDNDCDGLTDDESWECQDRDSDGIKNGVDVINILDLDGTAGAETVCVPAHLVLSAPWADQAAYRQGTPDLYWSGMHTLEGAALDPLTAIPGAADLNEWCHDFSSELAANYIYRYVGQLGANGLDPVSQTNCNDWVRSDINAFCEHYSDAYCRQIFASDGCQSIGKNIGVNWSASGLAPM